MTKPKKVLIEKTVLNYITRHPGVTAMGLRDALGCDAVALKALLRGLREKRYVRTRGATKATAYTVTAKALSHFTLALA